MYLVKTPRVIQKLFPNFHWRVESEAERPTLYLTFDDGPIPQLTPWVLEQLEQYDAKATFFCVGNNVRRHPEVLRQVVAAGHTVGNHTTHHLDGWKTDNVPYFHDVRNCAVKLKTSLFRPPYGRLKPTQIQFLQRHYDIVMWDVLSGDFDPELTAEDCFDNVTQNARSGSIVVLHDSLKAEEKLRQFLPRLLRHYTERGFAFDRITPDILTEKSLSGKPRLKTA